MPPVCRKSSRGVVSSQMQQSSPGGLRRTPSKGKRSHAFLPANEYETEPSQFSTTSCIGKKQKKVLEKYNPMLVTSVSSIFKGSEDSIEPRKIFKKKKKRPSTAPPKLIRNREQPLSKEEMEDLIKRCSVRKCSSAHPIRRKKRKLKSNFSEHTEEIKNRKIKKKRDSKTEHSEGANEGSKKTFGRKLRRRPTDDREKHASLCQFVTCNNVFDTMDDMSAEEGERLKTLFKESRDLLYKKIYGARNKFKDSPSDDISRSHVEKLERLFQKAHSYRANTEISDESSEESFHPGASKMDEEENSATSTRDDDCPNFLSLLENVGSRSVPNMKPIRDLCSKSKPLTEHVYVNSREHSEFEFDRESKYSMHSRKDGRTPSRSGHVTPAVPLPPPDPPPEIEIEDNHLLDVTPTRRSSAHRNKKDRLKEGVNRSYTELHGSKDDRSKEGGYRSKEDRSKEGGNRSSTEVHSVRSDEKYGIRPSEIRSEEKGGTHEHSDRYIEKRDRPPRHVTSTTYDTRSEEKGLTLESPDRHMEKRDRPTRHFTSTNKNESKIIPNMAATATTFFEVERNQRRSRNDGSRSHVSDHTSVGSQKNEQERDRRFRRTFHSENNNTAQPTMFQELRQESIESASLSPSTKLRFRPLTNKYSGSIPSHTEPNGFQRAKPGGSPITKRSTTKQNEAEQRLQNFLGETNALHTVKRSFSLSNALLEQQRQTLEQQRSSSSSELPQKRDTRPASTIAAGRENRHHRQFENETDYDPRRLTSMLQCVGEGQISPTRLNVVSKSTKKGRKPFFNRYLTKKSQDESHWMQLVNECRPKASPIKEAPIDFGIHAYDRTLVAQHDDSTERDLNGEQYLRNPFQRIRNQMTAQYVPQSIKSLKNDLREAAETKIRRPGFASKKKNFEHVAL